MSLLAGSVFSWSVVATALGQSIVNTCDWIFSQNPVPPTATALDVNTIIRNKWRIDMIPLLPVQYVVQSYTLVEILGRQATAMPGVFTPILGESSVIAGVPADDTGDLVGNVEATFVAATIQKKTGFAGRRSRGGARIGPLLEENVTNNALIDPYRTALSLAAEFFTDPLIPLANHQIRAAVFSRRSFFGAPGKPATPGLVSPFQAALTITTATLNTFVGSQVSRKQTAMG